LQAVLYYAHDPMCSWCRGFGPVLRDLEARLPSTLRMRRLLGGLAEDTDEPMPLEQQRRIQATWQRIEERIPGMRFNHEFWTRCQPSRSTWAACRAVIAARAQGAAFDRIMTRAIQDAYYLQARNPSDTATLVELATELHLDVPAFRAALNSSATVWQLEREMALCDRLHVGSFPALVLETGESRWPVPVDYLDAAPILARIDTLLVPA
jgi:putative protein-disulfide isomerase